MGDGLGTETGKISIFFFWVRRRGRRLGTMGDASMGDWTSHTENARVFRVYLRGGPILIGPVLIFWRYFYNARSYTIFAIWGCSWLPTVDAVEKPYKAVALHKSGGGGGVPLPGPYSLAVEHFSSKEEVLGSIPRTAHEGTSCAAQSKQDATGACAQALSHSKRGPRKREHARGARERAYKPERARAQSRAALVGDRSEGA